MMGKIVITAGEDFVDIDILACAIAYDELLKKEGKDNVVVLPGEFNKSITSDVKKWITRPAKKLESKDVSFVIVDISQPEHLAKFVETRRVIELYDHHFGYEKVWQKIINGKIKIEPVGACATLIWEEYKKRGFANQISQVSARLIVTAIISNTLNFKASVTDKRDIKAYEELKRIAKLPRNWIEKYFEEQEASVFKNPQKEIINDTHVEKFPNLDEKLIIGQIELWDSRKFINDFKSDIKKALESYKKPLWFLTSPSISEGKNYIYCESEKVKKLLKEKLDVKFKKDIGTTKKLILRKEIKRIIYNY